MQFVADGAEPARDSLLLLRGLVTQLAARLVQQVLGLRLRLLGDAAGLVFRDGADVLARVDGVAAELRRLLLGRVGRALASRARR